MCCAFDIMKISSKNRARKTSLSPIQMSALKSAIHNTSHVSGLTHNFYRYPARFSPEFARTVISLFSKPGDLVFDPFVGGGTSLVEARALGRRAYGADINSLATFVSKTKVNLLTNSDYATINQWSQNIPTMLSLRNSITEDDFWDDYLKNVKTRDTQYIRKSIHLALNNVSSLSSKKQEDFVRCIVLRTAQWALDARTTIPNASDFRKKLMQHSEEMLTSAIAFSKEVKKADKLWVPEGKRKLKILNRSSIGIDEDTRISSTSSPSLILTSPPYPGVHVLYHRWQVNGRRETPAPYWIANKLDGSGESFYTFGNRKEDGLTSYFMNTLKAFKSIANLSNSKTMLVQIIAFSEPDWQLPIYIETLESAGWEEAFFPEISNSNDNRIWRIVPNRKWYATCRGATSSSKEVVLFHKLR